MYFIFVTWEIGDCILNYSFSSLILTENVNVFLYSDAMNQNWSIQYLEKLKKTKSLQFLVFLSLYLNSGVRSEPSCYGCTQLISNLKWQQLLHSLQGHYDKQVLLHCSPRLQAGPDKGPGRKKIQGQQQPYPVSSNEMSWSLNHLLDQDFFFLTVLTSCRS